MNSRTERKTAGDISPVETTCFVIAVIIMALPNILSF